MLREQRLQIGREDRVARANGRQPGRPFAVGDLQRLVEERAERAPAVSAEWRHDALWGWERVPDRMMQIEAGLLPATLNGPFRSAAHDCDVSEENPQKNFKSTISARSGSTLASSSSASPISSSACDSETLSESSVPSEEISNNPLAAATAGAADRR